MQSFGARAPKVTFWCVDTTSGQKQKQQGEKKKRDLKFTRVCQGWHGLPAPKNQEKVGVQKKKGPYIDMGVPELTDDNAA